MKEIANYPASKYQAGAKYQHVADGIYRCLDATADTHDEYVTSLSFVQEPELEEGTGPQDISQYPLEDILDRFLVYVSDFYEAANAASEMRCQLSSPRQTWPMSRACGQSSASTSTTRKTANRLTW